MKYHYVYMIYNTINKKRYIGKRSCICAIEEDTYMGSGVLLKKAINKYGLENFEKRILKTFETEDEALEYEKHLIDKLNACEDSNYYNIASGGLGGDTKKGMSESQKEHVRQLLSIKFKGANNPNFGKLGKDSPNYGRTVSKETRVKLSRSLKGMVKTPEWRQKISKSLSGNKLPDEVKVKISKSLKGKMAGINNPNYGKKGSLSHLYGKKRSSETKSKISDSRKGLCIGKDNPASRPIKVEYHDGTYIVFDTIKDAINFYQISKGTLYNWINNGVNKSRKFKNIIKSIAYIDQEE